MRRCAHWCARRVRRVNRMTVAVGVVLVGVGTVLRRHLPRSPAGLRLRMVPLLGRRSCGGLLLLLKLLLLSLHLLLPLFNVHLDGIVVRAIWLAAPRAAGRVFVIDPLVAEQADLIPANAWVEVLVSVVQRLYAQRALWMLLLHKRWLGRRGSSMRAPNLGRPTDRGLLDRVHDFSHC